jgi:hypothetical protein
MQMNRFYAGPVWRNEVIMSCPTGLKSGLEFLVWLAADIR